MSAEEKKFLSGCGCYMRFEQKVIHSLDELEKADPARFRRGSALFLWGYLTAPKIAVCLHGVVAVQGGNGIEQRRQKVGFGISHLGVIIPDAVADTLNVHGCNSGEPILNIGGSMF